MCRYKVEIFTILATVSMVGTVSIVGTVSMVGTCTKSHINVITNVLCADMPTRRHIFISSKVFHGLLQISFLNTLLNCLVHFLI